MAIATNRTVATALVLDLLAVTLFVVLGRRTHQESSAIVAVMRTLAPFLMALLLAWVLARVWEHPFHPITGGVVWTVTVVAGMFARRVLFGEGIATTFIIVTAAFLAAAFVGWRLIASLIVRQAAVRSRTDPAWRSR